MNTASRLEMFPLLKMELNATDTKEIIENACKIADEHIWYDSTSASKARFVNYHTQKEFDRKASHQVFIKVPQPENMTSVYEVSRFHQALIKARQN